MLYAETLLEVFFKPHRRIITAVVSRFAVEWLKIKNEEGERNGNERLNGLGRRLLSTLCPCPSALATVRPGYASALSVDGVALLCGEQ
jgi:hypothetical protein